MHGTDIGIVRSDNGAYAKEAESAPDIDKRTYIITKFRNEGFRLILRSEHRTVQDLTGEEDNFHDPSSGTFLAVSAVFVSLDVIGEATKFGLVLSLAKRKTRDIATLLYVAGNPTKLFCNLRSENDFHMTPILPTSTISETYHPTRYSTENCPRLVSTVRTVDTRAVDAVIVVHSRKCGNNGGNMAVRFIDALFGGLDEFKRAVGRVSPFRRGLAAPSRPKPTRLTQSRVFPSVVSLASNTDNPGVLSTGNSSRRFSNNSCGHTAINGGDKLKGRSADPAPTSAYDAPPSGRTGNRPQILLWANVLFDDR